MTWRRRLSLAPLALAASAFQPLGAWTVESAAAYQYDAQADAPAPLLEGVLIIADVDLFEESGVAPFSGVRFLGETLAERQMRRSASGFLSQPLTIENLNRLSADLTLALDQAGYSVADVAVPEQEVRGGVVQIIVRVGALGDVRVEGNKHFSAASLKRLISLEPGETIRADRIKRDLITVNTNPFRQADVIFERGDAPGETDIVLNVSDRRPFRVFSNYANNGVSATGLSRFAAGASYGDVWGKGHVADAQFAISDDGESYWSVGGSYIAPLRSGHVLSFSGDYIRTNIPANEFFDTRGASRRLEAKYSIPLTPLNLRRGDTFLIDMTHELSGAFQYKRFNNTVEFGGTQVFESSPEIFQFAANYALSLEDELGAWNFNASGVYSPGGFTEANSDEFFTVVREDAKAVYAYMNVGLSRVLRLPYNMSLVARARAQLAGGRLVAPEQFAIGGASTVRGFQEATSLGDQGYFASAELRSPLWTPKLTGLVGASGDDQLQAAAFFDIGDVWNHGARTGFENTDNLASAGVGVRYRYAPHFTVKADLGFQLVDDPRLEDGSRGQYGHVSITFSY